MFNTIEKGDIVFVEWHYQDMMEFYEVYEVGSNYVSVIYEYNKNFGDPEEFAMIPSDKCRLVCKYKDRKDK